MICSNCGAQNPIGLKFCEQCATPFKKRCAQCGFENSAAARFCGECAASLSAAAPELATQPRAIPAVQSSPKEAEAGTLEGERKTVTALFADLKGSTALMEELDPEEARAIRQVGPPFRRAELTASRSESNTLPRNPFPHASLRYSFALL